VPEIWRFNVAITDYDWYRHLASQPEIDEINFWQPKPGGVRDPLGTPWLFKLHAPRNVIVGGAFFTYYARLPVGMAWETFGPKNGVDSFEELLTKVSEYRKVPPREIDEIGCVILGQPFFFEESQWIPIPADWSPNIVKGKHYALKDPVGAHLWQQVAGRIQMANFAASPIIDPKRPPAVGKPLLVVPRLGQGSFRVAVIDAYQRRCGITGERTLPALEAAHIKPFSIVKEHDVSNGLSLRSDIHRLYDQGYVSIRPDHVFVVSKQIREQFENGRDYYALNGRKLIVPSILTSQPSSEALDWHYSKRFRG
jgi:putative restriction endonuclease